MSSPAVSVVIPTYNRAHCITEAIDSVLAQTFSNLEVIVVDDGSTDDTAGRLAAYGERIRVIHQVNAGVSAARNTGISAARGVWTAFLDSDGIWDPRKIEIQLRDLQGCPMAVAHAVNVAICGTSGKEVSLWKLRGMLEPLEQQPFRQRALADALQMLFYTQAVMVRSEVVKRTGGFRVGMQIHEDVEFMTKIALEGPVMVNSYCGVKLRRINSEVASLSSIHQDRPVESHQNRCLFYEGLINDQRLTSTERSQIRRRLSGARFDLSTALGSAGQHTAALRERWRSVVDNPSVGSAVRFVVGRRLLGGYKSRTETGTSGRQTPFVRGDLDASPEPD